MEVSKEGTSGERKRKKPRLKEKYEADNSPMKEESLTCPYCGLENQDSQHTSDCTFKPPQDPSKDSPVILIMNLSRQPDWCPYESLRLCLQSSTTCRGVYPLIFTPPTLPECPALTFFGNIGAVNDYDVLEEMVLASAGGKILLPKRGKVHVMDAAASFEPAPWSDFSHLTKPSDGKFFVEDFGEMWKVSIKEGLDSGVVIKEERSDDEDIDFGLLECQVDIKVKEDNEDEGSENKKQDNYFKCSVCPIAFQFEKSLNSHMRHRHTKCVCKHCKLTFQDSLLLEKHVATAHKTDILKNPPTLIQSMISKAKDGSKFSCDVCDYETFNVSSLKKHVSIKHEGEFVKCDDCAYSTRKKDDLMKHKQTAHGQIALTCPQCSYETERADFLSAHIQEIHSLPLKHNEFTCEIKNCIFKTNSESGLKRHHSMAHANINETELISDIIAAQKVTMSLLPYTCSIPSCSFGCFTERGLKAHTTMKHTKPGNIGNQNARTITKMKASEWGTVAMKNANLNLAKSSETAIKNVHQNFAKSGEVKQNAKISSNGKLVLTGTKRKITKLNASEWAKMGIHPKSEESKQTGKINLSSKVKDLENGTNENIKAQEETTHQEETVSKDNKTKIVADDIVIKTENVPDDIVIKQEPEIESKTNVSDTQNFPKNRTGLYACEKCSFIGKQKSHIVDHVKSVHEGVRYSCDHCAYKATTKSSLYRHERRKHSNILI